MKSIKYRLLFYILLVSMIPVIAFLLYTLLFVSSGLTETEIEANQNKVIWADQYFDQVSNQIEDVMYSLHLKEDILSLVDASNVTYGDIEELVRDALYTNSNVISKVTVVSTNTYRGVNFDYENGFSSTSYMYDELFLEPSNETIGLHYVKDGTNIYAIHTINDFVTKDLDGIIILRINNDVFDEFYTIFGDNSDFALFSSEGDIYSTSNYDTSKLINLDYSQKVTTTNINNNIVWSKRINQLDLFVASIVLESEVEAFSRNMIFVGLVIIVISVVITSTMTLLVTNDISSPLISLSSFMEGSTLKKLDKKSNKYQELNVLEDAYNEMIDEINQLITDKYKSEIERQSAQLKALQAQINPHFLSNTFQLIGGMALEHGYQDIYTATIKMSQLVRYSMRIDQKATEIREELLHIKDYLDIQKLRFGSRLTYKVNISEKVASIRIPKFTFQPIIENSFKYGLKKINRPWEISIWDESNSEGVSIIISDNGVGLSNEEVDYLNSLFNKTSNIIEDESIKVNGIGLINIDARIKLLYGDNFGLTIRQNNDIGVQVEVRLPSKEVLK